MTVLGLHWRDCRPLRCEGRHVDKHHKSGNHHDASGHAHPRIPASRSRTLLAWLGNNQRLGRRHSGSKDPRGWLDLLLHGSEHSGNSMWSCGSKNGTESSKTSPGESEPLRIQLFGNNGNLRQAVPELPLRARLGSFEAYPENSISPIVCGTERRQTKGRGKAKVRVEHFREWTEQRGFRSATSLRSKSRFV